MPTSLPAALLQQIEQELDHPLKIQRVESLAGGSINRALAIHGASERLFVKLHNARHHAMFVAEAHALQRLRETHTLRVPAVICHGHDETRAWLVLEHLSLRHVGNAREAGRKLAALHRHTAERFGFAMDNFIGLTPQHNEPSEHWCQFFRERRLRPQLRWLEEKGMMDSRLQASSLRLLNELEYWLGEHHPAPSLLHGDLWSGNFAYDADGAPCLFDPASYHGDRETDLAMTRLFGGFPPAFYQGYAEAWPLPADAKSRETLYNLYHILNHANLFGSGYLAQAASMIDHLLQQRRART